MELRRMIGFAIRDGSRGEMNKETCIGGWDDSAMEITATYDWAISSRDAGSQRRNTVVVTQFITSGGLE